MNKLFLSSLITASLLSAPSFADEPRFGLFGALGQADHDLPGLSESATSFALGGEYKFSENFALEGRYDDYGTAEYRAFGESADISASSFGVGVKGLIPLNEQFSVFAKIGFASWDLEADGDDESGSDLYYGFGAQYMATEQLGLGIDYTMMDAEIVDGIDYELSNLSVSATFYF